MIAREQIRQFRLHTHHLDRWYEKADALPMAGACGLQNSPPGAWETALGNRIGDCDKNFTARLLEEEKSLLQAWSFRGAPVVFPTEESATFLSALIPRQGEPWIYTNGIGLALDFLQMSFEELLPLLTQVMPRLDGQQLKSKTALDQTLAQWMLPLLPAEKRELWNSPSMYGSPDRQTVGGAVVSFLLRPCSFLGLVVFGGREGVSPTFTSYESWVGRPLSPREHPEKELARKYLHCFGPATLGGFTSWLGCSPSQAKRIWQALSEEMESVELDGRELFFLSADRELLLSPPPPERRLHLLGPHDPYLGLQDRETILEDRSRQRQVWQTVSNPGAVLWQGEVAGIWKPRKKGNALHFEVTLWGKSAISKDEIGRLAERYALFGQSKLHSLTFL